MTYPGSDADMASPGFAGRFTCFPCGARLVDMQQQPMAVEGACDAPFTTASADGALFPVQARMNVSDRVVKYLLGAGRLVDAGYDVIMSRTSSCVIGHGVAQQPAQLVLPSGYKKATWRDETSSVGSLPGRFGPRRASSSPLSEKFGGCCSRRSGGRASVDRPCPVGRPVGP